MAYLVNRLYEKRATEASLWDGRVGKAELKVDDKGVWTLDGKELGRTSIEYLMNFSLQSLQDAYAGAKTKAEAEANFEKKLAAIQNGTIGARGEAVGDEVKIGRRFAEAAFIAAKGKDAWAKIEDKTAKADEILAKNAEAFAPMVEAEIARLAEARKAKAAIAAKMGAIDL